MSDILFGDTDDYQRLIDEINVARLSYFQTLGEPDADMWFPIVNPAFQGGPQWPTRPAWQRIRNGSQTIIISSGLTDPFGEAEPNIGLAVETAVATTDTLPSELRPSWLLDIAQIISNQAAVDGRFNLRHAQYGIFLFGVPNDFEEFRDWIDESGTMGFLIGIAMPGADMTFALPGGTATLLTAKLLTPAEYAFVAEGGLESALKLREVFERDGTHHLSSLVRASVI